MLWLPLALRFLFATDPKALTPVLAIGYRTLSEHLLQKGWLTRATRETGAVTLIQRFGSAPNLNIHCQMLFLDGAYLVDTHPPDQRHDDERDPVPDQYQVDGFPCPVIRRKSEQCDCDLWDGEWLGHRRNVVWTSSRLHQRERNDSHRRRRDRGDGDCHCLQWQ